MPQYDFYCRKCRMGFETFMHVKEHDEHVPRCPSCGRTDTVEGRLAQVSTRTSKKS